MHGAGPRPGESSSDRWALLDDEAARHGLHVRAVFAPEPADDVPALESGEPARALALVGNVGSSLWPSFSASAEHGDGEPDPLDRWSRRIGTSLAQRLGARVLFPFGGPPHHPFQRWAMRGGALHASPIGLLVDAEHGLWHAFRFALAFAEPLAGPNRSPSGDAAHSPCATCAARPCLQACPVDAFVEGEYRVARCVAHLAARPAGPCISTGCLARHACPVGQAFRYLPAQARLHMRAFAGRRAAATGGTLSAPAGSCGSSRPS